MTNRHTSTAPKQVYADDPINLNYGQVPKLGPEDDIVNFNKWVENLVTILKYECYQMGCEAEDRKLYRDRDRLLPSHALLRLPRDTMVNTGDTVDGILVEEDYSPDPIARTKSKIKIVPLKKKTSTRASSKAKTVDIQDGTIAQGIENQVDQVIHEHQEDVYDDHQLVTVSLNRDKLKAWRDQNVLVQEASRKAVLKTLKTTTVEFQKKLMLHPQVKDIISRGHLHLLLDFVRSNMVQSSNPYAGQQEAERILTEFIATGIETDPIIYILKRAELFEEVNLFKTDEAIKLQRGPEGGWGLVVEIVRKFPQLISIQRDMHIYGMDNVTLESVEQLIRNHYSFMVISKTWNNDISRLSLQPASLHATTAGTGTNTKKRKRTPTPSAPTSKDSVVSKRVYQCQICMNKHTHLPRQCPDWKPPKVDKSVGRQR